MPCNWLIVLVCSHACKNIYLSPYLAEISEFNGNYRSFAVLLHDKLRESLTIALPEMQKVLVNFIPGSNTAIKYHETCSFQGVLY